MSRPDFVPREGRRCVYIAGAPRSGTTLILNLMGRFADTYAHALEASTEVFEQLLTDRRVRVVKRTHHGWRTLHALPEGVDLVYAVRHPFDVLTSRHPWRPGSFHTSASRWRAEYGAYRRLRAEQPGRDVLVVRYEDVCTDPDGEQARVAEALGLEVGERWSDGAEVRPHGRSVGRWRHELASIEQLRSIVPGIRAELAAFCEEFGYDLDPELVV